MEYWSNGIRSLGFWSAWKKLSTQQSIDPTLHYSISPLAMGCESRRPLAEIGEAAVF
jgi:hypothetical protein